MAEAVPSRWLAVLQLGAALLCATPPLAAQGVTGAAIEGRVLDRNNTPVEQAIVRVTNTSTGERWQTTTRARGRYFIDYLSVGGPYRIGISAIGYEPSTRDSIFLALGDRLVVDFTLTPAALELKEITVTSAGAAASHTGPAQVISDSTISRLAISNRDYTELAVLSPQVTKSPNGGLSFAGLHDRFNSIQIDGTNNIDPFGRSGSGNGTPGWAVKLTAFTPEAVKELQIVTAPFDVRYGNFAGGLINAVTKSGTNRVEGSIRGNLESSDLTGTDADGNRASQFSRKELGLTLGAPIIRDRVAFFANVAYHGEVTPQSVPVPTPGDTTTGALRYESLVRFRDLLRSYGVEPGSFSTGSYSTPSRNLFVKITAQLGLNSTMAVSHNYGYGNDRREIGQRDDGTYDLSSSGTQSPETINATRLAWTTAFGARFTNQMTLARVDDRQTCLPTSDFPAVTLVDNTSPDPFAGTVLNAGRPGSCAGLEIGHTLWEITDNFGMAAGNHRLTFGTHGERTDLVDDVLDVPDGVWSFDNLDSLAQGKPTSYARDFSAAGDTRVAFRGNQIGVYAQDQWVPTPHLTVTAGLRLDVPFVPTAPAFNLRAWNGFGIHTSQTPSGNALWSPRLGVNYDPSGRGTTVLRGGVGFFAGPPAYVWFRNVYGTAGIRANRIDCEGDAVPAFTLDPKNQPSNCAEPAPLAFPLAYFDPNFRFPRDLKVALGADRVLTWGIVGTVDVVYTRFVNSVELVDVNLRGPVGISAGEGGRVLYGTIDDSTGRATPSRVTNAMSRVVELRNSSGDRSYSATAQLEKRFSGGTEVSAAYTYTDARDRMGMLADRGSDNVRSTPVDGTLEERNLRTSFFARPHKITLVGTTNLPFGFRLGFTYIGMSGQAYTYVASGDANADGLPPDNSTSNDVVYVPRDASDITLADPTTFSALDKLIRSEPCLQSQRGRLLERDSCRDPWVHETTAQLSKRFGLADRRTLELTADLFNVLNFVNNDWGLVRGTFGDIGNAVPLLQLVGYDSANSRGVYVPNGVDRRQIDVEASRWRLQLAATVFF